jgi:heat shock protein HslJ
MGYRRRKCARPRLWNCRPARNVRVVMRRIILSLVLILGAFGCIADADGRETAVPQSEPDTSMRTPERIDLAGTMWTATRFRDGEQDVTLAPDDQPGTVKFDANGFVTGGDGCNRFGYSLPARHGVTYEIRDDLITFGGNGAVSSQKACVQKEYLSRFWAVLTGEVTYEVQGTTLTLTTRDRQSVTYTAAT